MLHRLFVMTLTLITLALMSSCDAKPTSSTMSDTQTYINFKEIADSLHLAHEASVEELFTQFSRRPPNKRGNFHQKVFEDEAWIYWGKPIFKGLLFNERRVIKKLYKTSKSELSRELPIYDELWAHTLRSAAANAIRAHRASHKLRDEVSYPSCASSLVKRDSELYQIAVHARVDVRSAAAEDAYVSARARTQAEYHILLSAQDFSLMKIKTAP